MSFDEKIRALAKRVPALSEHVQTEEATKNALVMPFIAALGYDVFDPQEVIPEFVADVGTKKGEKVDYAVKRDGEIVLLIECKKQGVNLRDAQMSQLFRYFGTTNARIGLLTNGIQYRFYSDLDEQNKMDTTPFLELNLADLRDGEIDEVKNLSKGVFELERILSSANELKYKFEIRKILEAQYESPDEEFVRFFFSRTNTTGRFTAAARDQFTSLVGEAFSGFVRDKIRDRLQSALQGETAREDEESVVGEKADVADRSAGPAEIVTTEDELAGFRIVQAIVCKRVPLQRVAMRDTKTYFGVLLDDNNRKPICRLWFNSKKKYLGVFDAQKTEQKIPITDVVDIYEHADLILRTLDFYGDSQVAAVPESRSEC